MRRRSLLALIGLGCCALAGFHAHAHRNDLKAPFDTSRAKFSQVRIGMTPDETKEILGPPGYLSLTRNDAKTFAYISGSESYWAEHSYSIEWWENELATITVTFFGRKGNVRVIEVKRAQKTPLEIFDSLAPRVVCLWLIVVGTGLILFSLVPNRSSPCRQRQELTG